MQSQVNGDILGVVEYNTQTYLTIVDRIDYSMFGVPRLLPTAGSFGGPVNADVDNDNNITNGLHPDGAVDVNDLLAFLALFEAGDARGDLAGASTPFPDGATDINDLIQFAQLFELGTRSTTTDRRFAWRGYQWDPYLNLYHVRNRTFDPKLISWLQPDPLGDIDGPNVYAYVGWDPFNRIDPYGLQQGATVDPSAPVWRHTIHTPADFRALEEYARRYGSYQVIIPGGVVLTYRPGSGSDWSVTRDRNTHDAAETSVDETRRAALRTVGDAIQNTGTAVQVIASVGSEPADVVMTVGAIAENPSDWRNYVGLLPFVPGTIRKVDVVVDAASGSFKSFTSGNFKENLEILLSQKIDSTTHRAHHIVAHGESYASAARAREILVKHGIDVNDPVNGAALKIEYHGRGMHTNDYYDWVERQLREATSQEEAKRVLQRIRETLEKGEQPWIKVKEGAEKCE